LDEYKQKIERLEKEFSERKMEGRRKSSLKIIEIPKDSSGSNNQSQTKLLEGGVIINTLKADLSYKEKLLEEVNAVLEAKRKKCRNYKTNLKAKEVCQHK
jgi:hypothetical protein